MPDAAAWIFPGQGSQEPGMGRDLYESSPAARALFDRADTVLGRPITGLCFEAPVEELGRTENAQSAIYVTSLACLAAVREQLEPPSYVAGHSMGEYTALAAAGALEFEAGLRLVEERGRLTQQAAAATPGGMMALLGLEEDAARAVCEEAGAYVCNLNAPGQVVIGGARDALERAKAAAQQRGARRAVPLDVAGAFHTPLMEPAVAPFRDAVAAAGIVSPQAPFVSNRTADAMEDPADIGAALVFQLTNPVRWTHCVEYMTANGVAEFIEFGPGRVLTGLVKRIAPGAGTRNVSGVAAVQA